MSESWFVGEHGYIGLDCIDRAERRARERYEAERDWGTDLAGLIARPFHLLALALSPGRQAEERARIKEILAEELGKLEEPTKEQAPLLRMQGVTRGLLRRPQKAVAKVQPSRSRHGAVVPHPTGHAGDTRRALR